MCFVRNGGINFAKALFELANTTSHVLNLCIQLFVIRRGSAFVREVFVIVTMESTRGTQSITHPWPVRPLARVPDRGAPTHGEE